MATVATLTTPYSATTVDNVSLSPAEFPVPPLTWGFAEDLDEEMAFDSVSTLLAGAVFPESRYLEPTIGQIWPR